MRAEASLNRTGILPWTLGKGHMWKNLGMQAKTLLPAECVRKASLQSERTEVTASFISGAESSTHNMRLAAGCWLQGVFGGNEFEAKPWR